MYTEIAINFYIMVSIRRGNATPRARSVVRKPGTTVGAGGRPRTAGQRAVRGARARLASGTAQGRTLKGEVRGATARAAAAKRRKALGKKTPARTTRPTVGASPALRGAPRRRTVGAPQRRVRATRAPRTIRRAR